MLSVSQWQSGLFNSKARDNALFLNERLSDLTITFPLQNISFPAHRLMMAKTSPYFENLLYGPISIQDQEWKVKDNDVDPGVFKVVLAHCYDVNLLDESLEKTFQVYKLADCYLIESLKSQCLEHLQNTMKGSDFQCAHELSTNCGFSDMEDNIFEIMYIRINLTECTLDNKHSLRIYERFSNFLLNLPLQKHKKLLGGCEHVDVLFFEESWRHPKQISDKVLMSIFENSSCKNYCENDCSLIKGCISPKILGHFINMKQLPRENCPFKLTLYVFLSLIDVSNSQELYECVTKNVSINSNLYIHLSIPCNKISPEILTIWSSKHIALYISDVDDQSLSLVEASIIHHAIVALFLPRCSLSLNGFKRLLLHFVSTDTYSHNKKIHICSPYIKEDYKKELNTMATRCQIEIYELDEDIPNW